MENKDKEIEKIINKINTDKEYRINLCKRNYYWFFITYFTHYIKYPTAPFQKEIFEIVQDEKIKLAVIVSFRGSAKSTIISLGYPIWSIVGIEQRKFPLIVCFTQQRAQDTLSYIRAEFEKNHLLQHDFGPFNLHDSWRDNTLMLTKYKAKITAVSTNENIRGIRNYATRPDLIICDDIEDTQSAKTKEGRDKGWQFLNSEVFPTGDKNTKKIIIGNLVHEDSIINRLSKSIKEKKLNGVFRAYPLIDNKGKILWKEKFPNMKAIKDFKKTTVANEVDWQREYLLKIVPTEDQVIYRDWIQYYDDEEIIKNNYRRIQTAVGVDLAISDKSSADYTAMVSATAYRLKEKSLIVIKPYPVNLRLSFPDTINKIIEVNKNLGGNSSCKIFIEEVGYQPALIQELKNKGLSVEGVKVGISKRERLIGISHWIKNGQIIFPKKGCEDLIDQVVNFGVESHDDLVDALTIVCGKLIERLNKPPLYIGMFITPYDGSETYYKEIYNEFA